MFAEPARRKLALVTAIAGAVTFCLLALLVPCPLADDFDLAVLRRLRSLDDPELPIGGRAFGDAMRDFTALGGTPVLVLVVLAVVAYLALDRRGRDAMTVLVAAAGGLLLSIALKMVFSRERPDVVPHLVTVHSPSFPSGHSMLSAVIWLTLGVLLARFAKRRANEVLPIVAAVVITLLVGCSRLVLGVHYPTDVLAGWAAGASWAACTWLVADRLAREGAVEGRADA